jgi:hypothetical protein
MAILYAAADGSILGYDDDMPGPLMPGRGIAPVGTVLTREFDPVANPALAAALSDPIQRDSIRLVASPAGSAPNTPPTITQRGAAVPVAAPTQAHTDRQQLSAIRARLEVDQALSPVELRALLRLVVAALP